MAPSGRPHRCCILLAALLLAASVLAASSSSKPDDRPHAVLVKQVTEAALATSEQQQQQQLADAAPQVSAAAGALPDVDLSPEWQAVLQQHNTYRSLHQAPPLAWSYALAQQASSYVAQCVGASDPSAIAGEILTVSPGVVLPGNELKFLTSVVDGWYYSGAVVYDYSAPGFSQETGSFTQLVWKSSTRLGCALQVCSNGISGTTWPAGTAGILVSCRYSPAGNVGGLYRQNVLLPLGDLPSPPPPSPPPPSPPLLARSPPPPSPASILAPPPLPATDVPDTFAGLLAQHNAARATHQVAPLAWSPSMAAEAAAFAQKCIAAADINNLYMGENVFASSNLANINAVLREATTSWYAPAASYSYTNPESSPDGFQSFAQIVWKSSSTIGCHMQICSGNLAGPVDFSTGVLVVCRYYPRGNVQGLYTSNVLPPVAPRSPPPPRSPSPSPRPPPPPPPPRPFSSPAPPPPSPPPPRPNRRRPPPPASPPPPPANNSSAGTLGSGESFTSPACLASPRKRAELCVFADANVVLLVRMSGGVVRATWSSNTGGASTRLPFTMTMRADGALVATDADSKEIWSSKTKGRGNTLVVKDAGSMQILSRSNKVVWRAPQA